MSRRSRLLDAASRTPIRPAFQPIVDLDSMTVVGYEALARWPEHPEVNPAEMFDHARLTGTIDELDWACRRAAIVDALDAGLTRPLSLFVNVEPATLRTSPEWPFPGAQFREIAGHDLQIIVELTERELLADPASVLAAVDWARDRGCGIALDDVGLNPASLALLPLVLPDVVKLDRRIMGTPKAPGFDQTVSAVVDYASASGAKILAEGIEDDAHLAVARTVGATLGQGYLFGRPAPAPEFPRFPPPEVAVPTIETLSEPLAEPADLLDRFPPQYAPYSTILRVLMSLTFLREDRTTPGCIVISVQNHQSFARRFAAEYADLASTHTLVGIVGADDMDIPSIRSAASAADRFDGQFAVAVLTQTMSATVVARDLGDEGPLRERRYAWYYTHDRGAVRNVARCIVCRLAPAAEAPGNSAEPPVNSVVPPANSAELPGNSVEPPVNSAELLGNSVAPSVNAAELPVGSGELSIDSPKPLDNSAEPPVSGDGADIG